MEEVDGWWRQAGEDIDTAEALLDVRRYYAVSWFVQQAVEKGLKALYMRRTQKYGPRTHSLVHLGRLLQVPVALQADLDFIEPTFDLSRYPSPDHGIPADRIDRELAEQHLEAGRRVIQWLKGELRGEA